MRLGAAVTAAVLVCSCGRPSDVRPTPEEEALARRVGVDLEVAALLKGECGSRLHQLMGMDEGGSSTPAAGLTGSIPQERARKAVLRLREKIVVRGYMPFHSEMHFGIGGKPDELSVLKTSDGYEILRIMGTNGINYGLETEKVIAKLREWEGRHPFDVVGASFDWVEVRFRTLPPDLVRFMREVYAFCPDIVDQGTGTVEAAAAEVRRTGALYLWWD